MKRDAFRSCGAPLSRGRSPPSAFAQVRQRFRDAALRSAKHEIVEVPEVTDPEDLAGELAEALPQRHVEALEHDFAEDVGAVAFGHEDRGERARVLGGISAKDLKPPCARRA